MEKKTTQNIMSMDLDEIRIMVKKHGINVCIIGIGRIGLPTAITFANSGLPTIGVDVNQELVDMINSGNFPLKDEPGYEQLFEEVIKTKKLIATTKIEEAVHNSDVIVLSLPTPMIDKIPDYSALQSVAETCHFSAAAAIKIAFAVAPILRIGSKMVLTLLEPSVF